MGSYDTGRRVKTADTVFDIIQLVQESDGAGVSEIAEEVDLAKSTVHDYLNTLVDREYLVKEGNTYRIGLKFLYHGMNAQNWSELVNVVRPALQEIADETGEIVWFLVEEQGKGVYLEKARGTQAVQPYGRLGDRVHLHGIAAGKAILAHLPDERVHEIVDRHGLPKRTEQTITDPDELFTTLEQIRERGYAFNDNEAVNGLRAVASPVHCDGEVLGSIVVSGPESRIRGDRFRETFPELVTKSSNTIELTLASR